MTVMALLAVSVMLAAACSPETLGLNQRISRNEAMGTQTGEGGQIGREDEIHKPEKNDTLIFASAVEFPQDYDWHRDTAYGNISGKIVLLRNGVRVLELDAGLLGKPSVEADMHHLLDGHLYTEYIAADRTYIDRDGKHLYDFDGREYLRGILQCDNKLYTLSQRRNGRGFVLRCDGKSIFEKESGTVLKSFFDYPERRSGALYENDGQVCFHYRTASENPLWYSVQGTDESQIYTNGGELLDAHVYGDDLCTVVHVPEQGLSMSIGKKSALIYKFPTAKYRSVSLLKVGGELLALGKVLYGTNSELSCIWSMDGVQSRIKGSYNFAANVDRVYMYGTEDGEGTVVLDSYGKQACKIPDYIPSLGASSSVTGSDIYLALSHSDSLVAKVGILTPGKVCEVPLNGFLTGVEVVVE